MKFKAWLESGISMSYGGAGIPAITATNSNMPIRSKYVTSDINPEKSKIGIDSIDKSFGFQKQNKRKPKSRPIIIDTDIKADPTRDDLAFAY